MQFLQTVSFLLLAHKVAAERPQPFCGTGVDAAIGAADFCAEKQLAVPTKEEVCKYAMFSRDDLIFGEVATSDEGLITVGVDCPGVAQCPEYAPKVEDEVLIDANIPDMTKCQLKRSDEMLKYEPNVPASRPDVYIEVEVYRTGETFKFYPHVAPHICDPDVYPKCSDNSDGTGLIPIVNQTIFNILFNEQEDWMGLSFKMRFVGDRGPGAWNSCSYSPIAFDLGRDGTVGHITDTEVGYKIDISGDGEIEHLKEWFAPDEGILIDYHSSDGSVISGEHLMGDMAGAYADGFAKLKTYDANCDDRLTGDELDGLYIWVDKNSNLKLDKPELLNDDDEGELFTLDHFGIRALNTIHDDFKSYAELNDGNKMLMHDLWFDGFAERRLQLQKENERHLQVTQSIIKPTRGLKGRSLSEERRLDKKDKKKEKKKKSKDTTDVQHPEPELCDAAVLCGEPPEEKTLELRSAVVEETCPIAGAPEMIPNKFNSDFTLYKAPVPNCGDLGQEESFQGQDLKKSNGECFRINICHGTAGGGPGVYKWNQITVGRSQSGNGGLPGHRQENHNDYDGVGKLPDYYPGQIAVPNPNGAGKYYGSMDEGCNFVPHPCEPEPATLPGPECSPEIDCPTSSCDPESPFACPEFVCVGGKCIEPEPSCSPEPKTCEDGSTLNRVLPDCDFEGSCPEPECSPGKKCPTPTCSEGPFACPEMTCDGGDCVESKPTCSSDTLTCDNGETFSRILPNCDFEGSCPEPECSPEKACPIPTCVEGPFACPEHTCVEGECVASDPSCSSDTLTCGDESTFSRSLDKDCGFEGKCSDPPEDPNTRSTPVDDKPTLTSNPGTRGDPHFKTHSGEMYDFHGGCDLVLLDNPDFENGLGMLVHVRTKIETWWSYVETAAIRIGDQTLELSGGEKEQWLFINGAASEPTEEKEWQFYDFAGHKLRVKKNGKNREAHIPLGNLEKLVIKTFNGFVKVEVAAKGSECYTGSHGLLGRFPDGKRVARDGETFIEDVNAFGQEWQVTAEEPKLFHSYDDAWVVPAGQRCAMPEESATKVLLRKRRLASGLPTQEAEKACAHLADEMDRKACIFDVIATQDTNMASVW